MSIPNPRKMTFTVKEREAAFAKLLKKFGKRSSWIRPRA